MTGYELFRRRIAPVLFLGVVGLIVFDTCSKNERTHATIVLDLGSAASVVRTIGAELVVNGETINTFHRTALGNEMGTCQFKVAMPAKDGELDIKANGKHLLRHVHADEGATITVPLADELLKP